jgi:hypothetical protein
MNKKNDWTSDHYNLSKSYPKTAEAIKHRKITIVETQLKTDYEKSFRNRDVLIQNSNGDQKWVPLNWIRCTFIEAVKTFTDDQRLQLGYNDPANRYARHMARKMQKEQVEPAIKALCQEIERVTGEYVYRSDKIETLELNTLLTLTKALSCIKTDLQAVAS